MIVVRCLIPFAQADYYSATTAFFARIRPLIDRAEDVVCAPNGSGGLIRLKDNSFPGSGWGLGCDDTPENREIIQREGGDFLPLY